MKRFALALLLPLCLFLFVAPAAQAKMTAKKAKKLEKKWREQTKVRRTKYINAAGRYMYWQQTLELKKKTDAAKKEIQAAKKKRNEFRKAANNRWSSLRKAQRLVKKYDRLEKKLSSAVQAGKGWGGSEGVADTAKRIARRMGIPVTSQKRNYAQTIAVGSSTSSDHYTGNTTAFAVDFGVSGSRGTTLARRICSAYKISTGLIGTFNGQIIRASGKSYRIQLLWQVAGHYDHVHIGIRRQ